MINNIEVKASSRHLQISPQKVRLVINLVRGMDAYQALEVLNYLPNNLFKSEKDTALKCT